MASPARFGNRVAIVTGAASGIGLARRSDSHRRAANVVVADLDENKARSVAHEIQGTTSSATLGVACDVSNDQQVQAAVAAATQRFGGLDIIVNNAGVMVFKPLEQQPRMTG